MLVVSRSPHLQHFKELLGQCNHYLITILIGLDGVQKGVVTRDDSFRVKWDPRNVEQSVVRSRRFARQACLVWAVDALDAYLGYLRKKPFELPFEYKAKIANVESVYPLLKGVTQMLEYPIDVPLALVHLGIQWRNNLVHYRAQNQLDHEYATALRSADSTAIERFRGLDTNVLLNDFKDCEVPRFKEVAAIIQAIHYLVLEFDSKTVRFIDAEVLAKEIAIKKKTELAIVFRAEPSKLTKRLKQFLISNGFKESDDSTLPHLRDDQLVPLLSPARSAALD